MDPLSKRVQDPIQVSSSPIGCSDKYDSVPHLPPPPPHTHTRPPPLLREEIAELLKEYAVERVRNPGLPGFTPGYYWCRLLLKKKKNGKLRPVIDFSY